MRPINLNNIEEKAPGNGGDRLKPGAYPCLIQSVEDDVRNERLLVRVDICAGEHEWHFSDDFYKDKPWANQLPAYVFSYKEDDLPKLKGWLHIVSDCNPGFDAEAAIMGGNEQMLAGKAVGAVFREEEYVDKKTGELKMSPARPYRICRLTELEVPAFADPKPRMMTDEQKAKAGAAAPATSVAAEAAAVEVPF